MTSLELTKQASRHSWPAVRSGIAFAAFIALVAMAASTPRSALGAPNAQDAAPCSVTGRKVAVPARVRLGETVQIRLTLSADCPESEFRASDIMLAVDTSRSMASAGKLAAAKAAAAGFVDETDLGLQRVGLVTFWGSARVTVGLTDDGARLRSAIDSLGIASGTNLSAAIETAQSELDANGRPDAQHVIILLTDGDPNQPITSPTTSALRSANAAKLAGTTIYSIGVGSDVTDDLLKQLASSEDHYFFAPSGDDLARIYDSIALVVSGGSLRGLTLEDVLSPDVTLVAGSELPAAAVSGKTLTWTAGAITSAEMTWTYEVRPDRVGSYPTNVSAVASYSDADGVPGTFVYERPEITVLEAESACSLRKAWSVMVYSFPDTVGVSSSAPRGCNLRFDSGDWATGIAYRLPELEYVLTDSTGTVELARARGVYGAGRVDQRIHFRVCQDPPYRLRLVTSELSGYQLCPNAPVEREITLRDFRPLSHRSTQERFGFIR